MMDKIVRSVQLQSEEENRIISGRAVVFNSWSRDLGGFTELIRPEAITQELVENSDIVMCLNHDENQMLARCRSGQGTLHLELREDGLYFSFEAPDTPLGNEVLYNVRAGNYNECSFAFTIPSDGDIWYKGINGELKREIINIDGLYDCSIVTRAAYPATSVRFAEVKANSEEIDKALNVIKEEVNKL